MTRSYKIPLTIGPFIVVMTAAATVNAQPAATAVPTSPSGQVSHACTSASPAKADNPATDPEQPCPQPSNTAVPASPRLPAKTSDSPSSKDSDDPSTTRAPPKTERKKPVTKTPRPPGLDAELAEWDDRMATARRAKVAAIVGLNVFAWPYAATVTGLIIGNIAIINPLSSLAVPVVGGFIASAARPDLPDAERALFIADGVVQSVGAVTAIVSVIVMAKANSSSSWAPHDSSASLRLAPIVLQSGGGLGIMGSF